jgi:hypothetical protein
VGLTLVACTIRAAKARADSVLHRVPPLPPPEFLYESPPCCSYEAWIIYNFTSLLLAYVGGPGAVVVKAEGKVVHPSWSHLTCCLPAMQVRRTACGRGDALFAAVDASPEHLVVVGRPLNSDKEP